MKVPYPFTNAHFTVEIQGLTLGGFSKVRGLEAETETQKVQEGGVNDTVYMLPGQTTYSDIVLEKGIIQTSELWTWYESVIQGQIVRHDGTITLLNTRGERVLWWDFCGAFPHAWKGPSFDAGQAEIIIEEISLAHNGLSLPQGGGR